MHVSDQLRAMREEAGYSRDELAHLIGFRTGSALQRYENPHEYHRRYLRIDLVEKLIGPLTERGIPRAKVLALAGIPDPDTPLAPEAPEAAADLIPADLVRVAVEALATYLAEGKVTLSSAEMAGLVVDFCRLYADEAGVGSLPAIPDVPQAIGMLRLFHRGRIG